MRRFTDFIIAHRYQAMLIAFLLAYIPFLGVISIVMAALITLRKGIIEGFLVFVAATLPYLISFSLIKENVNVAILIIGFSVLISGNFLTWVFAVILQRYNNWSFILECAVIVGMIVVAFVHFSYPEVQNWWGIQISSYFDKTLDAMDSLSPDNISDINANKAQLIESTKYYATGVIVAFSLFNALFHVVFARMWQAMASGQTLDILWKELSLIRFSKMMSVLMMTVFLLSHWGYSTILDIMPILLIILGLAGLSLGQFFIAKTKRKWLSIVALYGGTVILFPFSINILSIVALVDAWVDFRQRWGYSNA